MPKETKKHFRCTLTINVFTDAQSESEADDIFRDMDMKFLNASTGEELEQTLIDWEVTGVTDRCDQEPT
jgi:hypothetical protein